MARCEHHSGTGHGHTIRLHLERDAAGLVAPVAAAVAGTSAQLTGVQINEAALMIFGALAVLGFRRRAIGLAATAAARAPRRWPPQQW